MSTRRHKRSASPATRVDGRRRHRRFARDRPRHRAAFVERGARVAITGRDQKHLDAAASGVLRQTRCSQSAPMSGMPDDAARADRCGCRAVRRARRARQQRRRRPLRATSPTCPPATGRSVIDTNLSGVFYCCRAALPHLQAPRRRLDHQHQQPGRQEPVRRRRGVLRVEGRAERVQRSADAGGPLRQHPGQLHHAGFGGHRFRRPRRRRGADWKIAPEDVADLVLDLVTFPSRSLPSRIELRPSRPKK